MTKIEIFFVGGQQRRLRGETYLTPGQIEDRVVVNKPIPLKDADGLWRLVVPAAIESFLLPDMEIRRGL